MPTAAVIYCSATWTTAGLAEDIGSHLRTRGLEATVASFDECETAALANVDYVLLGCWTHGLFVVGQHPDAPWVAWARGLPTLERPEVGLFTTYKVLTGSMFRRMREPLAGKHARIGLELKSRGNRLTEDGRRALDRFTGTTPG
jgi:flavodoxin